MTLAQDMVDPPASKNLINKGTAEQEQNGVTMPTIAAKMFPAKVRFPAKKDRTRSGSKKL
jgi:hypothetical protein